VTYLPSVEELERQLAREKRSLESNSAATAPTKRATAHLAAALTQKKAMTSAVSAQAWPNGDANPSLVAGSVGGVARCDNLGYSCDPPDR
jgi:hypothetical protein